MHIALRSYSKQRFIHKTYKYQLIDSVIKERVNFSYFRPLLCYDLIKWIVISRHFFLRLIYRFCDLNWIIVISFHRPNSPHSLPGQLINQHSLSWIWWWSRRTDASTKWPVWWPLMFRIEWKALSVWLEQRLIFWTVMEESPLICGASDKVFWGMLEIGYHKREVYYTTGASTTAGPKSILSHMSESHCIR